MISTALTGLSLSRFRSHAQVQLELAAKPVVLFGPNGAGKTNILEAISLLAPGRGLRRAPYQQATKHNSDTPWAVHADLLHPDASFRIGTGLDPAPGATRRVIRIDGETATAGALAALLRQVWLTPAQDRVFSGPRGVRLKYFDRLVFSLFPEHGRTVSAYEKAMRGRQRLLDDGGADPAWLDGLEQQMAQFGAKVHQARAETIRRLMAQIQSRPNSAFPKAKLALTGEDMQAVFLPEQEADCQTILLECFAQTRSLHAKAGRTLHGVHRADLAVFWGPSDMPAANCSTGEQKALLVGLSLAHARAVTADSKASPPLILLDEACAHLDENRRAALIAEIGQLQGQAWLSGTDRSLFEAFGKNALFFELSGNKIKPA
ncbi:DNA recombination and repair protein RecF [hydrothermal vent metagenome]|uniref:DNA recombination and repair protein RecF n=1 Tax=hydrothermal vent metagenome TaxID=652676 RepID=A0A3B0RVC7_9ZZZZ